MVAGELNFRSPVSITASSELRICLVPIEQVLYVDCVVEHLILCLACGLWVLVCRWSIEIWQLLIDRWFGSLWSVSKDQNPYPSWKFYHQRINVPKWSQMCLGSIQSSSQTLFWRWQISWVILGVVAKLWEELAVSFLIWSSRIVQEQQGRKKRSRRG